MKLTVPKEIADKLTAIDPSEFNVDTFRAGGKGGQHQNKNETGVRITHTPTGISAESRDSRSQKINRRTAFQKLVKRLIVHFTTDEKKQRESVGWAKKIRTYNEPRGTAKDHRTGVTIPYDKALNGEIDQFIDACLKQEDE